MPRAATRKVGGEARGTRADEIRDLYLSMRPGIARAVSGIVPPHEVEDIVQETYVRLCRVAGPGRIRHPKSYLFRTARNLALDSVKRAEHRLGQPWKEDIGNAGAEVDEVFERAVSSEEFGRFCEAVRLLPVQARRVFVLKKVYGYSQREIADELGLAESTVEKHVALAVRRCAEHMRKSGRGRPVRTERDGAS